MDIIKLTAQFEACNGKTFRREIQHEEEGNETFQFLSLIHPRFQYYQRLVDAYRNYYLNVMKVYSHFKERAKRYILIKMQILMQMLLVIITLQMIMMNMIMKWKIILMIIIIIVTTMKMKMMARLAMTTVVIQVKKTKIMKSVFFAVHFLDGKLYFIFLQYIFCVSF